MYLLYKKRDFLHFVIINTTNKKPIIKQQKIIKLKSFLPWQKVLIFLYTFFVVVDVGGDDDSTTNIKMANEIDEGK